MWNTILKGLLNHKRRLIATSSAVVIGVAFLAAALAVGDTLTNGFEGLFAEANAGTDVIVRNETEIGNEDDAQRGSLPADLGATIASVDGVASVIAVHEGFGQIVGADGETIGGDGPPTTATNWIDDSPVSPWALADGRAPRDVPAGDPYEVVIDRASATAGDLALGDQTVVKMPQPVPVTVVGVATFGGADSLGPTTYTAFTNDAIGALLATPDEVSSFRLAAEAGVGQQALRDAVAHALPEGAEALTGAELTDDMLAGIESDILGLFRTIMLVFAGIALVVAAFSIHNTFSILIAQRTRESALLRAIGASRRQVLTSVVVEAFVVGVIASFAGLAVGFGLATGFIAMMANAGIDLNVDGILFTTSTMVTAAAVGIVSTLFASIAPAVRAARVAPLAALREAATASATVSKVRAGIGLALVAVGIGAVAVATSTDSILTVAGGGALLVLAGAVALGPAVSAPAAGIIGVAPAALRGQTGRIARRNAMRDPRRTAGSASALMVGTAIVALFTTFGASLKATIEHTVDEDFGGDLVLVTDNFAGPGMPVDLAVRLDELPEVSAAVGFGEASIVADGADVFPTVADPGRLHSILDLDPVDGSLADVGPGQIAVSETWADDNGLHVGATIEAGYADGATQVLTIGATYANAANVGDIIMTPDDWTAHATQIGHVAVLIDLADGVSEADGQTIVDEVGASYGAPDVQTRSEYIDTIGAEVDQMLYFVYGMLGLAVLIALMGIANTLSLSIHERTRELGLLRAVGQTRAQVRSSVRWESVIVAVFGTIGGVGVGTFLGWGLMRALAAEEGFGVFAIPVGSLAIVVVLAALAGVVAAWRPARRAARLDILAAIATD